MTKLTTLALAATFAAFAAGVQAQGTAPSKGETTKAAPAASSKGDMKSEAKSDNKSAKGETKAAAKSDVKGKSETKGNSGTAPTTKK